MHPLCEPCLYDVAPVALAEPMAEIMRADEFERRPLGLGVGDGYMAQTARCQCATRRLPDAHRSEPSSRRTPIGCVRPRARPTPTRPLTVAPAGVAAAPHRGR